MIVAWMFVLSRWTLDLLIDGKYFPLFITCLWVLDSFLIHRNILYSSANMFFWNFFHWIFEIMPKLITEINRKFISTLYKLTFKLLLIKHIMFCKANNKSKKRDLPIHHILPCEWCPHPHPVIWVWQVPSSASLWGALECPIFGGGDLCWHSHW